ncbi:nuclear transport factor 2 family protein [Nocardia brevicatena]|uniref:nuclear transport factor 2 family protein n=1 Tax=Nocardia brevicatena TaxID=37327 RepID=UPI000302D397|nr:nuclear transport factor 2 family protein [Nocardia brevicatena]
MNIRRILSPALLPPAFVAACTGTRPDEAADAHRHLGDRMEITALVDRLGSSLDEGRFADLHATYTVDATARTPGGQARGRDALIAQASRNHRPDYAIQHFVTNVRIDLDGDSATVRANLLVVFARKDTEATTPPSAPQYTRGEVYHFDAIRTTQG